MINKEQLIGLINFGYDTTDIAVFFNASEEEVIEAKKEVEE